MNSKILDNEIYLTEQHIINSNHLLFEYCNQICFQSKNLYNLANYYIRQEFINNNKYLVYKELDKLLQNSKDYKLLLASSSQLILRKLDKNWLSFFKSNKDYKENPNKYIGRPKLPKYKHKTKGKNIIMFTGDQCKLKYNKKEKYNYITLPYIQNEEMIELSRKERNKYAKENNILKYEFKTNITTKIQEVRIIPNNNNYTLELVYLKKCEDLKLEKENILSIDYGVNNLATCCNNLGLQPFVINGKIIKSINQYYNKQISSYKSILKKLNNKDYSKRLRRITLKRNNKIKDYFHKASKSIIEYCIKNNIGIIIIGKNKEWKQNINIGKRNNQNFVGIPFNMLTSMIEYKGKLVGIRVIKTEESYTSKSSFIDKDDIPIYGKKETKVKFSGERIKRGLYKSKNNILINADVNGSYNILRKGIKKWIEEDIENIKDENKKEIKDKELKKEIDKIIEEEYGEEIKQEVFKISSIRIERLYENIVGNFKKGKEKIEGVVLHPLVMLL